MCFYLEMYVMRLLGGLYRWKYVPLMEFGCSADIELPIVNCNIGAGREFPECCTRYQQKIFALKKEKQKEQNCHRPLANCNMASTTAEYFSNKTEHH